MSKVDFSTIPTPATARDGDAVRENFETLSTASQAITAENIQKSSVFNRHLSDVDGSFKTILDYSPINTDASNGALGGTELVLATSTSFATLSGNPVLAIGKVPYRIHTPTSVSFCRIELQQQPLGAGSWTTISRKELSFYTEERVDSASYTNEETSINLFGMFEATAVSHTVRLVAIGTVLGVPYTQNYDFSGSASTNYETQLTLFVINN
tara:strand:+ start:20255 stop:20887 length:633 start_codon:yes stop_codon:yes gene_type:complete